MTSSLAGKTAFVTGAGSGFGRAISHAFARSGAAVFAADIDEAGLAETQAQAAASKLTLQTAALDVTDEASWDAALAHAFDGQSCDILVNNAGVAVIKSFSSMTLEDFQSVNSVNLIGAFMGAKAFIEKARAAAGDEAARGSIINISSVTAKRILPGFSAYATSKAALSNLTRALAVELGRKGDFFRVNAIAPGLARTAMTEGFDETPWDERDHSYLNTIPLSRYAQTQEVAKAALYLASERSKFVTGYILPVDGGLGDVG
ncbi:MAG: SDR family oxidoreductase [Pseudomonadota bacterium]